MLESLFNINVFQVALNLIIAIITAIMTARMALSHFYRQEIWLRKEKKYSEIIDKLCTLLNYQEKQRDYFLMDKENEVEQESIELEYKNAEIELEKVRFSTGFIIKSEVNEIISDMIKEFELKGKNELQGDIVGYIDRVSEIIKGSIEKVIKIANDDLKK